MDLGLVLVECDLGLPKGSVVASSNPWETQGGKEEKELGEMISLR